MTVRTVSGHLNAKERETNVSCKSVHGVKYIINSGQILRENLGQLKVSDVLKFALRQRY